MGLTCGLWSLIGCGACCILSYCHDEGGGGTVQFISTYKSICQDLDGQVLLGPRADYQGTTSTAYIFISTSDT